MKELKEKAQALIDKYTPELSSKGLKILLSKRYFESEVGERSGGHGVCAIIFNSIDRARDHKEEKKKGYNYEKNKYHYFILTLCPTEKNAFRREECREYAFILKKVERAHVGQEPRRVLYREEKILSKIEKQILKILKKAEKSSAQKVCQNNIIDAFRYAMTAKYEYKERFLGKESFSWEMIFISAFCVLVFGSMFIIWLFTK
ncbi:MAG: hypothetical protein E7679_05405 [Ruminococcaceae bacterium]|nr:hypothetical protein [Oscillospiraceae bacterium]